ncbi:Rop family plasmid primer RNA-binding protein [Erwinia rhapontici]|uniref:hypothetical protein n=1 Tax=Erwinia rhapontici TaxID=55212 RepID=UPI003D36F1A4
MKNKLDISQILNAASRARQLNALLQNIFEKGTSNGCPVDDEIVGIAYDISGKVTLFLDNLEAQENK